MTNKRWVTVYIILFVLTLVLFASLMYFTDPMLRYGPEHPPFTYYEYSEMYSNPGIAKQCEYDTVLVGTSMIENTDIDEFDKLLGTKAVKLPYSGGTTYNMKTILDVCFRSKNQIKTVYWELDEFQLTGSSTAPRSPLPDYLYEEDHTNDVKYLLNLDVFYHYSVKNIFHSIKGNVKSAASRGEMFFGNFSREEVISTYSRPPLNPTIADKDAFIKKTEQNLKTNIIPLIEANPDTEFVFYFVPFSILYWDRDIRNGVFDATMNSLEYSIGELLKHENATVYFYHMEPDIITDLDNYKDYSHYGKWINSQITEWLTNDYGRLSTDNYKKIIQDMTTYIKSFDFEEYLSNQGYNAE